MDKKHVQTSEVVLEKDATKEREERERREYERLIQEEYRGLVKALLPAGFWALTQKTGIQPDRYMEQDFRSVQQDQYYSFNEFIHDGMVVHEDGIVDEWRAQHEYPWLVRGGFAEALGALKDVTKVPIEITEGQDDKDPYFRIHNKVTLKDIQIGYEAIMKSPWKITRGSLKALQELVGVSPEQTAIEEGYRKHLLDAEMSAVEAIQKATGSEAGEHLIVEVLTYHLQEGMIDRYKKIKDAYPHVAYTPKSEDVQKGYLALIKLDIGIFDEFKKDIKDETGFAPDHATIQDGYVFLFAGDEKNRPASHIMKRKVDRLKKASGTDPDMETVKRAYGEIFHRMTTGEILETYRSVYELTGIKLEKGDVEGLYRSFSMESYKRHGEIGKMLLIREMTGIALPEDVLKKVYVYLIQESRYSDLKKFGGTTKIDITFTPEQHEQIRSHLAGISAKNYIQDYACLRVAFGESIPDIPWGPWYRKIEKLQAQAKKEKYDPWETELRPLMRYAWAEKILDQRSAEDGEILYEFVRQYGMYHSPVLLSWHVALSRAQNLSEVPEDVRQDIEKTLGISLDRVKQKGEILRAVQSLRKEIQADILADRIPEKVLTSDLGVEIFSSLRGHTNWVGADDDPQKLIATWKETVQENPDTAKLPEGYKEVTFNVPVIERTEKIASDEIEKLLKNRELPVALQKLWDGCEQTHRITLVSEYWRQEQDGAIQELRGKITELSTRLAKEENLQKRSGMEKQRERLATAIDVVSSLSFISEKEGLRSDKDFVDFMEQLVRMLPKEVSRREQIFLAMSALHASLSMPPARLSRFIQYLDDRDNRENKGITEEDVAFMADHLVQYVNEHYLHPAQETHQTGHTPFSKELLTALQQVWGLRPQVEKNIIVQTHRAIISLQQASEIPSTKTIPVTLVPARGVLRIFSGDIGDACFTSKHAKFAKGEFEKITAFVFVTNRGTKDERIQGSVLAIETKTPEGTPVLLVRANNPSENLVRSVDAHILVTKTLEEMKALAERRNIPVEVIPRDKASESGSNRALVTQKYEELPGYRSAEPIQLVDEPETNFNGYGNWVKDGNYPVIPIS